MKIGIAWRKGGKDLGPELVKYAREKYTDHEIVVLNEAEASFAPPVVNAGKALSEGELDRALVICGSSIGAWTNIVKMKNVIAAQAYTVEMAKLAREHNNANAIAIGKNMVTEEESKEILDLLINEPFSTEGRHEARVELILESEAN